MVGGVPYCVGADGAVGGDVLLRVHDKGFPGGRARHAAVERQGERAARHGSFNYAPLLPQWPAQCDLRVGDSCVVSEACMYAGTDGQLESTIPFNLAPLYVNTRWWRRARSARR